MVSGEFYVDWMVVSRRNPELFGVAFGWAAWAGHPGGASECNSIPCVDASLQEVCGPRPGTPGSGSIAQGAYDIAFDAGEGAFGDTHNGWAFSTSCLCGYTLSDMSPYGSDPNTYQGDPGTLLPNFNEIYGHPLHGPQRIRTLPCHAEQLFATRGAGEQFPEICVNNPGNFNNNRRLQDSDSSNTYASGCNPFQRDNFKVFGRDSLGSELLKCCAMEEFPAYGTTTTTPASRAASTSKGAGRPPTPTSQRPSRRPSRRARRRRARRPRPRCRADHAKEVAATTTSRATAGAMTGTTIAGAHTMVVTVALAWTQYHGRHLVLHRL